jgi:chorismate mutase
MVSTDLATIAAHLEGLEETIIHRLIDRAQFRRNRSVYTPSNSGFPDAGERSLFELRLRYQEEMDARFGRYQVPEECPYHQDLPEPERLAPLTESPLSRDAADAVNRTPEIVSAYLKFVPELCEQGDDGQYGSAVEHDVLAVQAIGRRIHYGALYVAESKYRASPDAFRDVASDPDPSARNDALLRLISRPEVEEQILGRVRDKVEYVQATVNLTVRRRVEPDLVIRLYRETVIPITKEGEIDYLLVRAAEGIHG